MKTFWEFKENRQFEKDYKIAKRDFKKAGFSDPKNYMLKMYQKKKQSTADKAKLSAFLRDKK